MQYNVKSIDSNYDFVISGVSYIGKPQDYTMMYISKKVEQLINNLEGIKCCLVFAENGISVPDNIKKNNCIVFTDNPQLDYAKCANEIDSKNRDSEKLVLTEEGYYIGNNVRIGKNAYIEPNVVIGSDCIIGNNATLLCGAVIRNSVIGDNFLTNEYAVIGSNGFTMAEDVLGNKIRIPSLGKVVIKDNVEIGAFDNISRGSAGNTQIDNNVKIDAHVHIGHDAHLEENTEITAGAIIGGFVEAGVHSYVGINAVVRNRKKLGENSFVGMGAVVTKSVDDNTVVVGNPAKEFRKG